MDLLSTASIFRSNCLRLNRIVDGFNYLWNSCLLMARCRQYGYIWFVRKCNWTIAESALKYKTNRFYKYLQITSTEIEVNIRSRLNSSLQSLCFFLVCLVCVNYFEDGVITNTYTTHVNTLCDWAVMEDLKYECSLRLSVFITRLFIF